jgi:hypothetical protein
MQKVIVWFPILDLCNVFFKNLVNFSNYSKKLVSFVGKHS